MTSRSFTVLLSSFLLFHLCPVYTHGRSLTSNSTQFNSSHTIFHVVGLKPGLPAKSMPISQSQIHAYKSHAEEGPGGSMPGNHMPFRSSDGSVEQEHQSEVPVGGMGAGLPTMSHSKAQLDFKEENTEDTAPHWHSEILQPDGSVFELDRHSSSPERSLYLGEPDDSSPIIKVSFSKSDQHHQIEILPEELQGGDPTSWTLLDFYDYLSPDYTTTESYPDDDQSTPADLEDENIQLVKKASPANSQPLAPDDGVSGGNNLEGPPGVADSVENDVCLLGFVLWNGTCQSPCDIYINYCFNGGQCYVAEGIGAFCRCNMQDYMWNKGTRCESVIAEFQVMCIVVSGVSVTLLILFMVIVFFSKRLHVLKIENRLLRKRSKSRPQSEQPNDNFSLSTVAEGSQVNVRDESGSPSNPPHALAYYDNIICQNDTAKPGEPVKTPVKEDESLDIQNSLIPKHENNTASADDPEENGVTIDLELLLPNKAKTHPESSPPLHYNVFLYKLPRSPKISPGQSRQGKILPLIRPRRGSEPGYSPMSCRPLNPRLGKACTP